MNHKKSVVENCDDFYEFASRSTLCRAHDADFWVCKSGKASLERAEQTGSKFYCVIDKLI